MDRKKELKILIERALDILEEKKERRLGEQLIEWTKEKIKLENKSQGDEKC